MNFQQNDDVFIQEHAFFEESITDEMYYINEDRFFIDDVRESSADEENNWKSDSEDKDSKISELKLNLSRFILKHRVPVAQVADLLSILRAYGLDLPKSRSGLLRVANRPLITRSVSSGECMYIGITKAISMSDFDHASDGEIVCDFNIDGLPLYKSSRKSVWPILGAFANNKNVSPFVVGAWVGEGHPSSSDEFFKDFSKELKDLTSNGIQIGEITKKFIARAIICDAPAKAFCKSVFNHNAKSGCHECNQVGFRLLKTPVYNLVSGELRTDESFKKRTDRKHHHQLEKLALEKAGINMVTQFPSR